jgi:hypothetical protein
MPSSGRSLRIGGRVYSTPMATSSTGKHGTTSLQPWWTLSFGFRVEMAPLSMESPDMVWAFGYFYLFVFRSPLCVYAVLCAYTDNIFSGLFRASSALYLCPPSLSAPPVLRYWARKVSLLFLPPALGRTKEFWGAVTVRQVTSLSPDEHDHLGHLLLDPEVRYMTLGSIYISRGLSVQRQPSIIPSSSTEHDFYL